MKAVDFPQVSFLNLDRDIFEQHVAGDNVVTEEVVEGTLAVDEEVVHDASLAVDSTDWDVVEDLVEHHYFYLRMGHSNIQKQKFFKLNKFLTKSKSWVIISSSSTTTTH